MLLDTSAFKEAVQASFLRAQQEILILSAYLKTAPLVQLLRFIRSGVRVTVVSRWSPRDLHSGASDLAVFEACQKFGAKFGVCPTLHGKVYAVDQKAILLGSANLTASGFGLNSHSNIEFGTLLSADEYDIRKLNSFVTTQVSWIDQDYFSGIQNELAKFAELEDSLSKEKEALPTNWAILPRRSEQTRGGVRSVWFSQIPTTPPDSILEASNRASAQVPDVFVGTNLDKDILASWFQSSDACEWLIGAIGDQELSFGALTALLHRALLDDPTPYRSSVKEGVSSLFEWAGLLPEVFQLTAYKRTRSIKKRSIDNN